MKKIFLFLLPVLIFAGCNKEEDFIDKNREKFDKSIENFFLNTAYVNATVKIEEYKSVNLPLKDMNEYKRLNDSLAVYIKKYEELEAHLAERGNEDQESAASVPAGEEKQRCDEDAYMLEVYDMLIGAVKYRMEEAERLYTNENYLVRAVVNEKEYQKCTPVSFHFNDKIEIFLIDYHTEKPYSCP